jgi:hypothetical protein
MPTYSLYLFWPSSGCTLQIYEYKLKDLCNTHCHLREVFKDYITQEELIEERALTYKSQCANLCGVKIMTEYFTAHWIYSDISPVDIEYRLISVMFLISEPKILRK